MGLEAPKINQCLFGYDDGHRLLATSVRLPEQVGSQLLLLSDLAPGASDIECYWTGAPLPAIKAYALIRTWQAPEMPRPGCVWSHVLLVEFADIGRFVHLGSLGKHARRPDLTAGFEYYSQALNSDPQVDSVIKGQLTERNSVLVLRALYSSQPAGHVAAAAGTLDDTVFAVWSQQWPRLRRSFAFRTAGSELEDASGLRFHLRVISPSSSAPRRIDLSKIEPWERAAMADLSSCEPTAFRRFIWRYGGDLHRGLERFEFLATLYTSTRVDFVSDAQMVETLSKIGRVLPRRDEGLLLKEDLLSWEPNSYSVLPRLDAVGALRFFLEHSECEAFALSADKLVGAAMRGWEERRSEILMLGELAADNDSSVARSLVARIAELIDRNRFLYDTRDLPRLRRRLVLAKPELLDSEELASVPHDQLSYLLTLLPSEDSIVERVIERLLELSDAGIASDIFDRYPDHSLSVITKRIQAVSEGRAPRISDTWLHGLNRRVDGLLQGGYLNRLGSTVGLAGMAEVLGYDRQGVVDVGPGPWSRALEAAKDDLRGEQRQVFLAFVTALALSNPSPGAELLLELAFEPLHSALRDSTLSQRAFNLLAPRLPSVSWWQRWDNCLRLRLGVVEAYEGHKLDGATFRRLTVDRNLMEQLESLRRERQGAWEFFD